HHKFVEIPDSLKFVFTTSRVPRLVGGLYMEINEIHFFEGAKGILSLACIIRIEPACCTRHIEHFKSCADAQPLGKIDCGDKGAAKAVFLLICRKLRFPS